MNTIVRGDKVTLRPITREDTFDIVRWRNNPYVLTNFIDQRLITSESHTKWLEKRVFTGEVIQFIIQENQSGLGIGSVYLRDIDRHHLHGEYGIFIGEDAWRGKGLGTEACRLLCSFVFEQLGMERIFLRVIFSNISAIRSYEKVGFIKEGILRNHAILNSTLCNVVIMGLLKEEYCNEKCSD